MFYYLIPPVCSLHHRCRSLQSCRSYWRDCVDHLWEYQDHHSRQLERAIIEWVRAKLMYRTQSYPHKMRPILWLWAKRGNIFELWHISHTCFTLHSSPPHITGASVWSCAGSSILAGTGASCWREKLRIMNDGTHLCQVWVHMWVRRC